MHTPEYACDPEAVPTLCVEVPAPTYPELAGRGESVVGLVTASWGQMQGGLTQAMP